MPKILVADDNSNVQKTMALALADLGVEVISVNNGEAAVRKLADVHPDLVLADIFMPVRNGYEVCEFVKRDSRFARVPVVLLVGAFDPLDEREAQRVGADGILKKPFVPPDPLITMVKTLLDRNANERLVEAPVPSAPVAVKVKTGANASADVHTPAPAVVEEPAPEEFPVAPSPVSFGEGDRPVAFGQLLETPEQEAPPVEPEVVEPVEDEQVLTSSRDSTLGEPNFWRNDTPETEQKAEPAADDSDELPLHQWGNPEETLSRKEDAGLLRPEPSEFVLEGQEEASPSSVDMNPIELDQAAQASLTVQPGRAPELAANPLDWLATAPPRHSDAEADQTPGWDEPIADSAETIDAVEPPTPPEPVQVSSVTISNKVSEKVAPQSALPPEDTARSVSKDEWAEMTARIEQQATVIATQHVAAISEPAAKVPETTPATSQIAAVNPAEQPAPDPALVEAVVQRILDKMRPQVVDIITKEFLRPVVQALVHREIEKS